MKGYRLTASACYVGFITQAIVNNLAPLLFIIFQQQYGITVWMLSNLILLNFGIQLCVDALSVRLLHRYGYRCMLVLAHGMSAVGVAAIGLLPRVLPNAYVGLVIATLFYACGSGMIEVAVSPVMHALPERENSSAMSFLHSFYCWGHMLVVLLSTLLLRWFGDDMWYLIPLLWASVPFANMIAFSRVPLAPMVTKEESCGAKQLFCREFLLFLLFMMAAGASELTVSQWASFFAEKGLGISKTAGDLFGPCLFAMMMGIGRLLYGLLGKRWDERRALLTGAVMCITAYLLLALSPWAPLSLCGCALCGMGVSVMWPGTLSLAAARFPAGGALMFGMLSLFGDVGCSLGPWLIGGISTLSGAATETAALKQGMLLGTLFPCLMLIGIVGLLKKQRGVED